MSTAELGGGETPEPPPSDSPWATPPAAAASLTTPPGLTAPPQVTAPPRVTAPPQVTAPPPIAAAAVPPAPRIPTADVTPSPAVGTASVPSYPPLAPPPMTPPPPVVPVPAQVIPAYVVPMQVVPTSAVPITSIPVTAMPASGVPVYPGFGLPFPASAPPGHPYGFAYYPYIQPPILAPTPRPAWQRWTVALVSLLVLGLVAAGGGLLTGVLTGADSVAAWKEAAERPASAKPPAANAPVTEWNTWARKVAKDAVAAQGQALLDGDEAGYLAVADPSNTTLVSGLKTRYANLRAMGVGAWSQTLGELHPSGDKIWTASLTIDYCFGEKSCAQAEISESTRWSVGDGRLVLSKLDASAPTDEGPRPWETDALTVKTGQRVVVASTKVNAWRVNEASQIADKAAAISDTFSKWAPPPSRYVIFFAGPNDWHRWYGMDEPDWAAAWSVPVARDVTEIVVRSEYVAQSDLQVLLAHEMTHVTTLAGPRDGATTDAWWLIEGIAEYASHLNVKIRDYDGVDATAQWVRGKWNGDPAVTPPGQNASQVEAGGKYGVAYLAVRHIAEKFGKEKMLDFWGRVVHDADSVEDASRDALNTSWTTVKADCARYIRDQVSLV